MRRMQPHNANCNFRVERKAEQGLRSWPHRFLDNGSNLWRNTGTLTTWPTDCAFTDSYFKLLTPIAVWTANLDFAQHQIRWIHSPIGSSIRERQLHDKRPALSLAADPAASDGN